MTDPLVSICLPNLNTRTHLQERVDTIFAQTYRNWELVVGDNYSDDGA
jgi:glycosyltransferase involved in cell wall biosynthesis